MWQNCQVTQARGDSCQRLIVGVTGRDKTVFENFLKDTEGYQTRILSSRN